MKILGIESSCDDTACAVVEDGTRVLSNVVSSQDELHRRFGGVVPEIACRAHIETILPCMDQALRDAAIGIGDVDAVAVTTSPGLVGALLIGLTAAKAASWALELPLISVDHLQAHIYAAWLGGDGPPKLPAVSLVVSGGHTSLMRTRGPLEHELLGATTDDAAGEAFDKVANILHLGYPGGPAIDRVSADGDPAAVDLPRAWLDRARLDFSFSGVKTAVLYRCLGQNASKQDIAAASYEPQFVADVAASFQQAVVDVLVHKTMQAVESVDAEGIIAGGGVMCNRLLRQTLTDRAAEAGLPIALAPRDLCRDNAAVVAGLGYHLYMAGRTSDLATEADPQGSWR